MFFHLQYIHLFRPFLKYSPSASPLPSHVSPRRICTANAGAISKLMRLYKKTYSLRQICNIAVYMTHSACTIHLLNLPERSAKRDITHGVKHLEEIAEDWLCARRTLRILSVLARKWGCELPEDAAFVLKRTDEKYGCFNTSDVPSPGSSPNTSPLSPMNTDDGSTIAGQRDYSPLCQYAQTRMTQISAPPVSIGNQMSMMPPLPAMTGSMPTSAPSSSAPRPVAFDAGRMDFSPDLLDGWTRQATGAPGADFATSFLPVGGESMPPSSGGQEPATSSYVPPSGAGIGINGQRWILNDSARWQQNFNGWDLVGSVPSNSVFVFGGANRDDGIHGPSETAEQASAGFEDLTASLNGGGWLPGLD